MKIEEMKKSIELRTADSCIGDLRTFLIEDVVIIRPEDALINKDYFFRYRIVETRPHTGEILLRPLIRGEI